MPKSRRCCIFVLILGGLHLVTGYMTISGCIGESATLYRGISFNNDAIVFNLYKNGDNNIKLAMLSKVNSDPVKEIYENGYGKKLSLENGTIRIRNLSKSDEGKYVLQHALGALSMKIEVHLVVLVAPPKQCTPNIKRVKNTLVASLDKEDCGNSIANVSWYKFCASNRSRPVCKLNNAWEQKGKTKSMINVGKEADTYCACAESSAMHCVRRFDRFNLCSCFKIEKDNILAKTPRRPKMTTSSVLSESTKRTTDIHTESLELPDWIKGLLPITSLVALLQVIVILIILYRCCKESKKELEQHAEKEKIELEKHTEKEKIELEKQTETEAEERTMALDGERIELEKVSSPSGKPELPEKNRTIDSEAPSPSETPEESERRGLSLTDLQKLEIETFLKTKLQEKLD